MTSIATRLRSVIGQDGAVILDIEQDRMLILNATGGYVWDRLRQGRQVDAIIRDLSDETGANPAVVAAEIGALVNKLRSMGLITT